MSWIQLHINTIQEHSDELEQLLFSQGANAVTLQDNNNELLIESKLGLRPLWKNISIVALFSATTPIKTVIESIQEQSTIIPFPNYSIENLADKNWIYESIKDIQPLKFGERLWICPSWHDIPDKNAINVMLDPGLAFGVGSHPTTSLCLDWLEKQNLTNQSLIDYGCGSGILGIAAFLLGASHIISSDIDPQALITTQENAEKNNISKQQLETAIVDDPSIVPCDIVVANILSGTLIELSKKLADLVKKNGTIVLSGILLDQVSSVQKIYSQWFDLQTPLIKDEWILLYGKRL